MFADIHYLDATRLTTLGNPLDWIYFVVPLIYILASTPPACLFRHNPLTSNKVDTPSTNPSFDQNLLFGIMAGTFVLLQSNAANMVYLSIGLFCSAFAHRPL